MPNDSVSSNAFTMRTSTSQNPSPLSTKSIALPSSIQGNGTTDATSDSSGVSRGAKIGIGALAAFIVRRDCGHIFVSIPQAETNGQGLCPRRAITRSFYRQCRPASQDRKFATPPEVDFLHDRPRSPSDAVHVLRQARSTRNS
jgi:hypothetical protein